MRPHVSTTRHPAVTNCTRCENLLTGRDDGMPTYVIQGTREDGRWLTEFLCEPCAKAEGYESLDEWRGRVLREAEQHGHIVKLTGPNSLLTPGENR